MNVNYYDVLDVETTASEDEIRDAWRSAVYDLGPTDRRFRLFNQAAGVLLDPEGRARYDAAQQRGTGRPESEASLLARKHSADVKVPTRSVRAWLVPGWVIVAVALLTAVALGYVGVTLTRSSAASVESDTSAAQAAAERAIVPILSYDAHHLGRSQAQATAYMTDSERAQYDKLFAVIRDNAPHTGTVVKAQYLTSGIVRSGTDRVDVLVFVNQATYNKQHPKTPVDYKNQVTVTMAKVGDSWLVDNLTTNAS